VKHALPGVIKEASTPLKISVARRVARGWAQIAELRVRVSLILASGGIVEDQELMEINGPYGSVEFVI
jgi:hypothetical protein